MPLSTELTQSRPTGPRIAPTSRRGAADDDESDKPGYLSVQTLRKKRNDYISSKTEEIEEQCEGRHYYHCAQWTAKEIEILRKRNQPIVTYNRVSRKINGIVGLMERQRQDPKAYPRTPKHEQGAEVATAAVRYVADANDWKARKFECTLRAGCEGIGGVEMRLIAGDRGDPDVELHSVEGENFFYDVRSIRPNFSDARHMGIAKWQDLDEAAELFPDKEEELKGLVDQGGGGDFTNNTTDWEKRFSWVSGKRLLLVEHWYKYKGRWCWAFYVGDTLLDEGESPFFDEKNKSMSRFIMFSANVDHDGDRYGFPRNLKGPQDEINQRRSKALYLSVSRQMEIPKGVVDDIEVARRERAKPDGVIETNPGQQAINYLEQSKVADTAAQFQFLQEAKDEIQNFANVDTASMVGVGKNLSGRAINALQQPGMAELGPFINIVRDWQIRVYRAIWCTIQRHWTSERWIRVTDDDEVAKFLQINGMDLDEYGQPVLVNALGNLDVDIILDEGPDVVNMMADVYDQVAQDPNVPFPVKLELMSIPGSVKQRIIKILEQASQQQKPDPKVMQIQMQAQLDEKADQRKAEIEKVQAQADIATDREKIQAEMGQGDREFQLKRELAMMEAALEQEKFNREQIRLDREHQQKMELARQQHVSSYHEHQQKMELARKQSSDNRASSSP